MFLIDWIGLRVAPYLSTSKPAGSHCTIFLGTFTFLPLCASHNISKPFAYDLFLWPPEKRHESCCIFVMQAYTGWQQLSCWRFKPVMLCIPTPPIWIIAILLPTRRTRGPVEAEHRPKDLRRKDVANVSVRRVSPMFPSCPSSKKGWGKGETSWKFSRVNSWNAQPLSHCHAFDGWRQWHQWRLDNLIVFCSDQHLFLPCITVVAPLLKLHHKASVAFVDLKRNNVVALPSNKQSHQRQLL